MDVEKLTINDEKLVMDADKVRILVLQMRLEGCYLDFDEEAKGYADATEKALKDDYPWAWPAAEKHLALRVDDRGDFEKDPEETEAEMQSRRKRWDGAPELITTKQAAWLKCAILASHALDYLQRYGVETKERITSEKFGRWFCPKRFYEYTWICLNQGFGPRVWKTTPVLPSDTASFGSDAITLVRNVVQRWEEGTDLGDIIPVLGLDDLFPAPADTGGICVFDRKPVRGRVAKRKLERAKTAKRELERVKRKLDRAKRILDEWHAGGGL